MFGQLTLQMVTFKMCINLRNKSKNLAQFKK